MLNALTIRLIVIVTVAVQFLCACSGSLRSGELLAQADSVVENNPDSALVLLRQIGNVEALQGDDERALYYLVLTQAQHKCYEPTTADSLMPFCVSHFASVGDSYNHVRALYYNAVTGRPGSNPEEAVGLLKECERVATSTGNLLFQVKVYQVLEYLNDGAGNYRFKLKYAKLFFDKSKEYGDPYYMAYAITALARAYALLEHNDSALACLKQALPIVNRLDSDTKALTLTNIGVCYHENGDDANAKRYLLWSLRVKPRDNALKVLADIYNKEGKHAEAEALWQRALAMSDPPTRISTLKSMAVHHASLGDYREAYASRSEAAHLSDSISNARLASRVTELQLQYDRQLEESRYYRFVLSCVAAVVGLVVVVISMALAFRHHLRTAKVSLQKKDAQLEDVQSRYSELEAIHAADAAKVEELTQLYSELSAAILKFIATGKAVCDEIQAKGRMPYSMPDAEKGFILYFAVQNSGVFNGWLAAYDKLTNSDMVYLALAAMGYTDKDIAAILCISEGAVRTRKYRLNKTKKAK